MPKGVSAMSKLYPDISHHHPVKDWSKVESSVAFLITKATEGLSYVDPTLTTFIKECEKRKIPYWLYTFLRKGNEIGQAQFLVKTCKNKVGKYFRGYVLDAESGNTAAGVQQALTWLQKQSEKTMVYFGWADYSKYKSVIENRGKNCAWWEARYGLNNGKYVKLFPCHTGVDLHQYTSKGVCPGIPDKIDMSRLTGTLPESWFTASAKKEEPKPAPAPVKSGYPGEYPVLPSRGYYMLWDGSKQLTKRREDIRKVQQLTNWVTGSKLKVDGIYGPLTEEAVKKMQETFKIKADGLFGKMTLEAAKAYKK